MQAADIVNTWDTSGDSALSKKEFREAVMVMLPGVEQGEVDALFNSLDDDGGGKLDLAEIKVALKSFADAAEMAKQVVREQCRELFESFRCMKTAQIEYQKQLQGEALTAQEEANAARREAEEKMKELMEAKAAQKAAVAEKKTREAAEKQAFEAKIAARRATVATHAT